MDSTKNTHAHTNFGPSNNLASNPQKATRTTENKQH